MGLGFVEHANVADAPLYEYVHPRTATQRVRLNLPQFAHGWAPESFDTDLNEGRENV